MHNARLPLLFSHTICLLGALLCGAWAQTASTNQRVAQVCFPPQPVASERWKGEYFNHSELGGRPVMVRDDGAAELAFNWGLGSPSTECNLGVDNFSARWTRTIAVTTGAYRFTVAADDGVRVRLDGNLIFNAWQPQIAQQKSVELELTAGKHEIVVEYFERYGSAAIFFKYESAPCLAKVPPDRWKAEYFNNANLGGAPVLVRDEGDEMLAHDWGLKAPAERCATVNDNFSARFTRLVTFAQGAHRFSLRADDGVRLYIDKQLKFEAWRDQMAQFTVDVELTAGNHLIVIEYFDHFGSAQLEARWEPHPCLANVPPDHWRGEYFTTSDFSGAPALVRDDGVGSDGIDQQLVPQPNANGCELTDVLTARWARRVTFGAGSYRFNLESSERVRLLLDGEPLLDHWQTPKAGTHTIDATVTAGNHKLLLEYGKAPGIRGKVRLAWQNLARTRAQ